MLLLYRFKLLYLSSYLSLQGNVSSRPENELVLGPSESVDLCIRCWEVQLAVHGVCMYHISCYLDVRGGTGLPCHRRSGQAMPETTSILNAPLPAGTYNLQRVGPVIELTGNIPKGSA